MCTCVCPLSCLAPGAVGAVGREAESDPAADPSLRHRHGLRLRRGNRGDHAASDDTTR